MTERITTVQNQVTALLGVIAVASTTHLDAQVLDDAIANPPGPKRLGHRSGKDRDMWNPVQAAGFRVIGISLCAFVAMPTATVIA